MNKRVWIFAALAFFAQATEVAQARKGRGGRKNKGAAGASDNAQSGTSASKPNPNPVALEDSVVRLVEEGRIPEAQAEARRSGASGDPLARLQGILYHAVGQTDQALTYLKQAYQASPTDPRIVLRLAEALCWKKDLASARALAEGVPDKALYVGARPWELMVRKARLMSWFKKFDEAEGLCSRVIGMQAPVRFTTQCRIRLAEMAAWRKDFPSSLKLVDAVLATGPGNVEATLVKGQVQEWQGHYKEARMTYAVALQTHPNDAQLRYRIEKLAWAK